MNFKKFHESKNLFDESTLLNGYYDTTSSYQYHPNDNYRCFSLELTAGTYTIFAKSDVLTIRLLRVSSSSLGANAVNLDNRSYTFTLPATETIYVSLRNSTTTNDFTGLTVMLNTGSTPLPYEPYSSKVWHDIPYYQHKTATDTLTLPAVIYPNDTSITVGIKGQSSQSGTPSPSNPVDVNGCGDRTGNLFNKESLNIINNRCLRYNGELDASSNHIVSDFMLISGTHITISNTSVDNTTSQCFYDDNKNFISSFKLNEIPKTIEIPSNAKFIRCTVPKTRRDDFMLNLGSTALPYEPYGFKIPILLNSTTINKYLGEVQTVRQIKKLVLDGTEEWQNYSPAPNTYRLSISNIQSIGNPAICSHFVNSPISEIASGEFTVGSTWIYIRYADVADLADFRSYLAQQYANGTPVTIYYVLSTPQTATVNEPLMKIGSYSDSLTTSIPVTAGENTLDVQTTVQPSEFTAGFSGWHPVSAAHERENDSWT